MAERGEVSWTKVEQPAASGGLEKSSANVEMKCPMCQKDIRTDHMSRHFSTHIPQVIADMSEEVKASHISKQNVIVQRPRESKEEPWCYCTVCKTISYDAIKNQNSQAWVRFHKKSACSQQWTKVQHLFNGGISYRAATVKGIDKAKENELKGTIQMLEGKITRVLDEIPLIMNQLNPYDKPRDRYIDDKLQELIAFLSCNTADAEDDDETETVPVAEPEPAPTPIAEPEPVKKVIRKATKAVGVHQAQEIV